MRGEGKESDNERARVCSRPLHSQPGCLRLMPAMFIPPRAKCESSHGPSPWCAGSSGAASCLHAIQRSTAWREVWSVNREKEGASCLHAGLRHFRGGGEKCG